MELDKINIPEYLTSKGFEKVISSSIFSKYIREGCFLEYYKPDEQGYILFEINDTEIYLRSIEALEEAIELYVDK